VREIITQGTCIPSAALPAFSYQLAYFIARNITRFQFSGVNA